MSIFFFIFAVLMGYLVGSICSAVIVSRICSLPDPRLEGSKNPGATNVLRLAGKKYALIVLLVDMLKGLLPVLLVKLLGAGVITLAFTCFATVIGHMYPVFFEFKGGKGVATALGAMLGFNFLLGMVVLATWLLIANFTRYSSLASIVSIAFAPFYSLFAVGNLNAFLPFLFIAIFVLYKHRDNITRLVDGTESKIRFSQTQSPIDEFEATVELQAVEQPVEQAQPHSRKTPSKATPKKKTPSRKAKKVQTAKPSPTKKTAKKSS